MEREKEGEDTKTNRINVDTKTRTVGEKRLRRTKSFEEKEKEREEHRPEALYQRDHVAHLWEANTSISKANIGDVWYVMSKKWLDSWREYVRWPC